MIEELVEAHNIEKARMIAEEKKLHFSYDESVKLTDAERAANEKLTKLREMWATPLYNVVL